MKKETFAFAALIVMIIISALNIHHLNKIETDVNTRTEKILTLSENSKWNEAEREAQILSHKWEAYRKYACIFLRHSEIDIVSTSILDIISGVQSQELSDIKNAAMLTEYQLKTLIEIEKVSFGSVL